MMIELAFSFVCEKLGFFCLNLFGGLVFLLLGFRHVAHVVRESGAYPDNHSDRKSCSEYEDLDGVRQLNFPHWIRPKPGELQPASSSLFYNLDEYEADCNACECRF